VRLDGVPDPGQAGGRIVRGFQKAQRVVRRQPRGLRTRRVVLGDVHAVVQPGRGQDDVHARALFRGEPQRRGHHALEVRRPVPGVRIRLIRDEAAKARLPVAAQA
jgi:hypothetical protein